MSTERGPEEREHPYETTSTLKSAIPRNPSGCWATWRGGWVGGGGGGDKACVTEKQPYQLGTPWGWDIPTLVCPLRPRSMNQVWAGGSKRNLFGPVGLPCLWASLGVKRVGKGANYTIRRRTSEYVILFTHWGFPHDRGVLPQPLIILRKMMR